MSTCGTRADEDGTCADEDGTRADEDGTRAAARGWQPTTLVLGPGGVKGFLEVGALIALEFFLLLKDVKRVVGVSVGAVVGLLLAVGYSPGEISKLALDADLAREVFVVRRPSGGKGGGLFSQGGLFSRDGIRAFLTRLVEGRLGRVPTLGELRRQGKLELVVVATSVERCEPVYLTGDTAPNISCIEAVMMSINIPLIFEYYELGGERYADGALTDPLPIQLYAGEDQLALRIVDSAGTQGELLSYAYAVLSLPMDYMAKEKLGRLMAEPGFRRRCRVIDLRTDSFNPVNPALPAEEKLSMIKQGQKTAAQFVIQSELGTPENATPAVTQQPLHPRGDLRRRLRPLQKLPRQPNGVPEIRDRAPRRSPGRKGHS